MRMKCIGGPFDGQYEEVAERFHTGDAWRIREISKLIELNYDPTQEIKSIVDEYHEYIIEQLRTSKSKIKFLRYSKISIEEILTKIFT